MNTVAPLIPAVCWPSSKDPPAALYRTRLLITRIAERNEVIKYPRRIRTVARLLLPKEGKDRHGVKRYRSAGNNTKVHLLGASGGMWTVLGDVENDYKLKGLG